jgi:hypothetical protein
MNKWVGLVVFGCVGSPGKERFFGCYLIGVLPVVEKSTRL